MYEYEGVGWECPKHFNTSHFTTTFVISGFNIIGILLMK